MESDTPVVVAESSFVLLLTGAPGAGKSEALTRVQDTLGADGIGSAAMDTDELARSYPPIDFDRHLAHLKALAGSFRQAGHDLLLVAATAESDEQLRAWLDAAGGERSCVVHLIAGPATLEERLCGREPADWFGLPELVESAKRLASIRFVDTDFELDTEKHGPEETAASIEAELRTRLGTSA